MVELVQVFMFVWAVIVVTAQIVLALVVLMIASYVISASASVAYFKAKRLYDILPPETTRRS